MVCRLREPGAAPCGDREARTETARQLEQIAAPELASRAGRSSPDPELTARLLQNFSEEAARLLLSDPDRYSVERLVSHARWVLGQFGAER